MALGLFDLGQHCVNLLGQLIAAVVVLTPMPGS
jgi:hypothetical protein